MIQSASWVLKEQVRFDNAPEQTGCARSPPPIWTSRSVCCGKPIIPGNGGMRETEAPRGVRLQQHMHTGLALSVKDKKLTEAEAMRRYAAYKSGGTSTCTSVGNAANC
jgi:hypothetical protein